MIRRIIFMAICVFFLSGCVAGQHIKMDYVPDQAAGANNYSSILLSVNDVRTFVLSGEKDKSYIGRYRGGFGNPFSVTTFQRIPLADQFLRDLKEEMTSLGFTGDAPVPSRKKLSLEIVDWNFEGFQNGRFWYEIGIKVEDASGKTIVTDTLKEEVVITGTVMMGARGGFEREVPLIYGKILVAIVRNNPKVLSALQK